MSGTFGKYDVVELIGQGGFGQVFRGRDPLLKRDVAIKTVSLVAPMAKERFMREAEIAAGLRHPAIVSIYDFGEQEGVPYLVQEFLPGEDLSDVIYRREPLEAGVRIEWLIQVAEALRFAHQNGVVHRDVKPSNVRIVQDGSVRLVDFGIAKVLHSEQQLTGTNQSLGTSGYLAPEQLDGREIDQRADIFSFGVLAYELLTLQKPFFAETVQATLYRILTSDPTPVNTLAPDVPPRLAACVERCLRKSRDERYPDFGPVIEELRSILQGPDATGAEPVFIAHPEPPAWPVPIAAATAVTTAGPDERVALDQAAAPVPAAAGSVRLQKIGIVAGGLVAVVALAWGGTAAVSALLGDSGPGTPTVLADSMTSSATMPDAADSLLTSATDTVRPGTVAGRNLAAEGDRTDGPVPAASRPAADAAGRAAEPRSREAGGIPAGNTAPPAAGGASAAATPIDPQRVLVLIRGEVQSAVATTENTVIAELIARKRPFVDPDVMAGMRADAAAMRALASGNESPAVAVGREYGAGTVVVADLVADASQAVAGLITGTAVLTAKYYDVRTGRLILSEKYQVGAGGTPGKAGVTVTDAVTQAAEAVARQLSRAILQKTGGG